MDNGGLVTFTGAVGETLIQATYTWEQDGVKYSVSNYVAITTTAPDHYTIQLHDIELEEATGVTADNFSEGTYYTYNSTTGFYHIAEEYVEGTTYYTNNFVQGDEITSIVVLKGIEEGDVYAVWAVVKAYSTCLLYTSPSPRD